ncbi:hypothetical protein A6P39_023420 [Streptomyces sp. FXJ1.172]|uniref:hypothetical protein n=1 Tax=Streptomyces sp. FXJ1.172 TaxID=710705 RepID=UPI0007CF32CA|nr:hypothetical protein [Streptomyces sp. FXJ1.172]WEO96734.1 hypothetical protein A6P39_023420 [Streptomyces sp. FXJ1.172]
MTKMKLLTTAALSAASAAVLAAPAHARPVAPPAVHDTGNWTISGTAKCADDLAVVPVLKEVSPLPLRDTAPACGEGSLIHQGPRGHQGSHAHR